ncbi:type II toxin-antitoxin system Phd/YefM family antitoxin [Crocosphaera watsonii]|uniref:Antitoxin n=1 Tax=Crocosphaera watsonii WH 8502 TaxID=423474 RepID=T2I6U6_CROWT|nr:type II toxin-antitoxin system Phd/YefM family antitoxin [Crocosphaera watsonii]CCQ48946.1 Prevent-host-death protein [Crocosphaera watsonii WH 8502]
MKKLAASDAKNRFGEMLDLARREPVHITKKGRNVAVVLSTEEFERLTELEDKLLAIKAKEEGFIRVEESEKLLQQLASTSAVVWSPQTDRKSIEALSELLKTVEDEDT